MTFHGPLTWHDRDGASTRVGHRTVPADGDWVTVPAPLRSRAGDWVAHHPADTDADETGAALLAYEFRCNRSTSLFPARLATAYTQLAGLSGDPGSVCLLYLHTGHQAESKTPILQKLLQTVGHTGKSHALRLNPGSLPLPELRVLPALLASHAYLLVIHDPLERLRLASTPPTKKPRFSLALFSRSGEPAAPARPGDTVHDTHVPSL